MGRIYTPDGKLNFRAHLWRRRVLKERGKNIQVSKKNTSLTWVAGISCQIVPAFVKIWSSHSSDQFGINMSQSIELQFAGRLAGRRTVRETLVLLLLSESPSPARDTKWESTGTILCWLYMIQNTTTWKTDRYHKDGKVAVIKNTQVAKQIF